MQNLQSTPKDKKAELVIRAKVDEVRYKVLPLWSLVTISVNAKEHAHYCTRVWRCWTAGWEAGVARPNAVEKLAQIICPAAPMTNAEDEATFKQAYFPTWTVVAILRERAACAGFFGYVTRLSGRGRM